MEDGLKLTRNRDAWATVRGYVYQVDTTITRWLDLGEAETLELERGEDIDIVGDNLKRRDFEQVKVRQGNLTLRASEANEALAAFHEHCSNNPNLKLRFRFVTNAQNGKEQTPWSMEESAIKVWEQIRERELEDEKLSEAILSIKSFLMTINRPEKLNKDTWANWMQFLKGANEQQMLDFIDRFEWGLHNPNPQDMKDAVEKKLLQLGYADNKENATRVYESLFCHIFRILSEQGRKRLSRSVLLEVIESLTVTADEKFVLQTLQSLRVTVEDHEVRLQAVEEKIKDGTLAKGLVWNVPHRPNPHFIGREGYLDLIREGLRSGHLAALTQTISGLGGIGKTQLALQYANLHRYDYDVVWWVSAEKEETIKADYVKLATRLKLEDGNPDEAVDRVKEWLGQHTNWLLIFDNANNIDEIEFYFPSPQNGHILVTSRSQDWPAEPISLSVFEPAESVQFLMSKTGCKDVHQEVDALELANELGHLPLALEHASSYIRKKKKTFRQYLDLYKERKLDFLTKEGKPNAYHSTVLTTWLISFESVKEESELAVRWLNLFAYLAPEQIPYKWFYDQLDENGNVLDVEVKDDAVAVLNNYSLVVFDAEEQHASVHRLVQEVVRYYASSADRVEFLDASVKLVAKDFYFEQYKYETWERCTLVLAHALMVTQRAQEQHYVDENVITILHNLGLYFNHYASYQAAKEYFNSAKVACESIENPSPGWMPAIYNGLSVASQNLQEYAESEEYLRLALSATEKSDRLKATMLNNAAHSKMVNDGDLNGALELYYEALQIEHKIYQADNPDTAVTRNNIAECLFKLGRVKEAQKQLEMAIKIERYISEQTNSINPNLATRLSNYARNLLELGNVLESLVYYDEALQIMEKAYRGDDHRKAIIMVGYGSALYLAGRKKQAIDLIIRGHQMSVKTLGKDHPVTLEIGRSLGLRKP